VTNETKDTSSFTNETEHASTVTNEKETNPPAEYGIARFGHSRFGEIQAGTGTGFTNETKHT
jgi:hypothetical protein